MCSDINETAARPTADAIMADGGRQRHCAAARLRRSTRRAGGARRQGLVRRTSALVINNAGVGAGGMPMGDAGSTLPWVLDISAVGPIHGCHVRASWEGGYGGIIHVASAAAFGAAPGMAA